MLSQHLLLFAWVLIHPFFASPSQVRKKQNMFSFTKNPLNTVALQFFECDPVKTGFNKPVV